MKMDKFNKGKAINEGLKTKRTDWIVPLDSDLILPKFNKSEDQ
jgi:glycosyltransferase involved in cell wall biosynthesis